LTHFTFRSLRSKRFRGVGEQRKTKKGIFDVLPARKMGLNPKKTEQGGRPIFRAGKTFLCLRKRLLRRLTFLRLRILPNTGKKKLKKKTD